MLARLLICAILLSATTSSIVAQEKTRIGIRAGVTFSQFDLKIKPDYIQDYRPDNGFYAGATVSVPLVPKLFLQPEIYFIEARSQIYEDNEDFGGTVTDYLTHISIPILANYRGKHFGVYAGPQISFRTKANVEYNNVNDDATDSYNTTNIAALIGVEYTIKYRFGIEVRYQQGISNIRKKGATTEITFPEGQRVRLGGFQTGLFFRFGKKPHS